MPSEKVFYICSFCNGRFLVPKAPPIKVRCPHCNSLLKVFSTEDIRVTEKGVIPIPAPGTRGVLGFAGGGLLGLAIGGPVGAVLGALLGGVLGAGSDASALEAKQE